MTQAEVVSFGCRLNIYESEIIRRIAGPDPDLVVINSCAVTGEAVRRSRQSIRRLKRARPDARIVVTGCGAQVDGARYAAMPEVASVVGNRDKFDPARFRPDATSTTVSDIFAGKPRPLPLLDSFAHQARAFLAIQTGCDHRCTFCIIPYGRGASVSVAADAVVANARAMVDAGFNEIVLTGVDLTSWGDDLPGQPKLGDLVQRLLRELPALPRLRLSSIDAIEIDPALLDAIGSETRLMPHLHLSLQAGDDMILKRMRRRHSRAEAVRLCAELRTRRPDIAVGADLIAGFPTETEAMFERSLALVADCNIVHAHIFPYSPRDGTPAARMPQVADSVRRDRAARLRAAAAERRADFLGALVGQSFDVLVELDGVSGHSPGFAPVRLASAAPARSVVRVRATAVADGRLLAEVVQ